MGAHAHKAGPKHGAVLGEEADRLRLEAMAPRAT